MNDKVTIPLEPVVAAMRFLVKVYLFAWTVNEVLGYLYWITR